MRSIDDELALILASQPNWKGKKLARLSDIILSSSPKISQNVKWKMPSKPLGSPVWEFNGIICVADYLKSSVRLTFPKGASLIDSKGLFNARLDRRSVRAIDFFESDKTSPGDIRALVKQAMAENLK